MSAKKLALDLVNFHAKDKLERELRAASEKGENFTYWMEPNDDRLYTRLQAKMGKYTSFAGIPMVGCGY